MADLYHIFILPKSGVGRERVEKELDPAVNWIRYHDRCYIIESNRDQNAWKRLLKPLVDPGGHLFICKLDPKNYEGWMPETFWKWYEPRALSQPAGTTTTASAGGDYPYGVPVPDKPGFVRSPYSPDKLTDVRGYAPGVEVKDPYTGKIFLVP